MSYLRVIPRDLFNEASLLKCLGRVYINLETLNMPGVTLEHDTDECEGFDIHQDQNSGEIGARNITLCINARRFGFMRPLNSRAPWPLYVYNHDDEEEIQVFDDNGDFMPEFVGFLARIVTDYPETD